MSFIIGPPANQIYDTLRARIVSGELAPDEQLPSNVALGTQFDIAPLLVRQVLAQLQYEGLVSREPGQGTFVRAPLRPAVLIVDDDPAILELLTSFVDYAGCRTIPIVWPKDALVYLEREPQPALVTSGIRMPMAGDGLDFIRTVRHRWPALPLVVIAGFPSDLAPLLGTPDWPRLVLTKPVVLKQILEMLRLMGLPDGPVAGFQRNATTPLRTGRRIGVTSGDTSAG